MVDHIGDELKIMKMAMIMKIAQIMMVIMMMMMIQRNVDGDDV